MPLKPGACKVCNNTNNCSVCGGRKKVKKEGKEVVCTLCKGTGTCVHCARRRIDSDNYLW